MIPYPHAELVPEGILAAAIENFAPAIMNGTLRLIVDGRILDESTIDEIAVDVSDKLNNEAVRGDVRRYLKLIRRAQTVLKPRQLKLSKASKSDLEALRTSALAEAMQNKLLEDEDVVLEIGFPLVRHGTGANVSLRAIIAATPPGNKPIDRVFREGMSLPDVRSKNPGELDLIMLVDDGLLATYLNFCEGKAHLDLLESKDIKQKLEENGFDGTRVKRLVKSLPAELRYFLTPDITEPDAHVFDSFFSRPIDTPGTKNPDEDIVPPPPPPPPPPKPPVFRVETLSDGLRIKANSSYTDWPVNVTIGLAYADGTRRPSWSPFDFKLDDLDIDHSDCNVTTEKNKIKAVDCGPDTEIEITGFDTNRELDTIIRPWKHAQAN